MTGDQAERPRSREPGTARRPISPVPPTSTTPEPTELGVGAALLTDQRDGRGPDRLQLVRQSVVAARILSLLVGVATIPVLLSGAPPLLPLLLLSASAMTALRTIRPANSSFDQVADTLLVAVILSLSHGLAGPFALFGGATAFSMGAAVGISGGIVSASVLVLGGVLGLDLLEVIAQPEGVTTLIGWVSLYPVSAVLGGLSGHVLAKARSGQAMLLEANRMLASLERLATVAPESLSPARVAGAAAGQFRRALDADIALLLFEREETLLELGRDSRIDGGPHVVLDAEWDLLVRQPGPFRVAPTDLPERLTRHLGQVATWDVVPLPARDRRRGMALIGGARATVTRATREVLVDLAAETAVGLDNTQLFARVEHAAAVAERGRLASDLHDGVAQQLTHVRFELELLARRSDDPFTRSELGRLARVASRATDDVRSAIRGLRAQALDEGLVPALRMLISDLHSGSGPHLELDVLGAAELDPDTTGEVYGILQEAVSNALRHSGARTITVSMDVIESTLVIVVQDDGGGLIRSGAGDGNGLGLRTMQARAQRIGAEFWMDHGDEGGVRIDLRLPLTQELP